MFCPRHGCKLEYVKTQPDVAASHDIYYCPECKEEWEWTEHDGGLVLMASGGKEVNDD